MELPFESDKKALSKVKNKLPIPTHCNCCIDNGNSITDNIVLVENKEIYGRNYGDWPWIYLCKECRAYVGLHPYTHIPLGTLADKELREARKTSKSYFEILHKSGFKSRSEAYKMLAQKMGIPTEECHFGWFDIERCMLAEQASKDIMDSIHIQAIEDH